MHADPRRVGRTPSPQPTAESGFLDAPVAILRVGLDGRIVHANPEAGRLLRANGPLTQRVPNLRSMLVNPQRWDILVRMLLRQHDLRGLKLHVRRLDGRSIVATANARLVTDGAGSVVELALLDASPRLGAFLDDSAAEASAQRSRDRAGVKDANLHCLLHELRTPIATILAQAEVLRGHAADQPSERIAALAGGIQEAAHQLNRLSEDLLDSDRFSRRWSEPERRPADIGTIVDAVVREMAAEGRRITVPGSSLPAVVDPAQMERLVQNLVANAIRHTPAGPISVRYFRAGDTILLQVDDRGPGVPEREKLRIFEPFVRGARSRGMPGNGIGLSLVANFARVHGGRAWVEDRPGGGASFRVRIHAPEPSLERRQ